MGAAYVPTEVQGKVEPKAVECAYKLDGLRVVTLNGKTAIRDVHWHSKNPSRASNLRIWGEAGVAKEDKDNKMGTTIKDTSKKVSVVGGGRGRVRGLCAAAPRCVRAAFAARTRAFGANTIKFRGGKWDEFGLAARARGRARGACSQRREYL